MSKKPKKSKPGTESLDTKAEVLSRYDDLVKGAEKARTIAQVNLVGGCIFGVCALAETVAAVYGMMHGRDPGALAVAGVVIADGGSVLCLASRRTESREAAQNMQLAGQIISTLNVPGEPPRPTIDDLPEGGPTDLPTDGYADPISRAVVTTILAAELPGLLDRLGVAYDEPRPPEDQLPPFGAEE